MWAKIVFFSFLIYYFLHLWNKQNEMRILRIYEGCVMICIYGLLMSFKNVKFYLKAKFSDYMYLPYL